MNYNVKLLQPLKLPNGTYALTDCLGIRENVFKEGYIPTDYITLEEGDTVTILNGNPITV